MMTDVPIRNAATVILLRETDDGPHVLMGQRGRSAAFMPNKFVFPGGAVDPSDGMVSLVNIPKPLCIKRLKVETKHNLVAALLGAAVREMWEETGHPIAQKSGAAKAQAAEQPAPWRSFFEHGFLPDAGGLEFIFRAITPPGRPRRFDARFFLGHADLILGDPDDFSCAQNELSHLQWVPLAKFQEFDLPRITKIVLDTVQNRLAHPDIDHPVPFYYGGDEHTLRPHWIYG